MTAYSYYGDPVPDDDEDADLDALIAELDALDDDGDDEESEPERLAYADIAEAVDRKQQLMGRKFTVDEMTGIMADADFQWRNIGSVDVDEAFDAHWKLRGREPWNLDNVNEMTAYQVELLRGRTQLQEIDEQQNPPDASPEMPEFDSTVERSRWLAEQYIERSKESEPEDDDEAA